MKPQIVKPLLSCYLFLFFLTGFTQTTSLGIEDEHTKEDSAKVNLLNKVAFNALKNTPEKSLEYII